MSPFVIMLCVLAVIVAAAFTYKWFAEAGTRRARYLSHYDIPQAALDGLQRRYPHLNADEANQVGLGLKRYFYYCQSSGFYSAALPSKVVAALWEELARETKSYQRFSHNAFNQLWSPRAAVGFGTDEAGNKELSRTWALSCRHEVINPRTPTSLPLLFALDVALAIPDGFIYRADGTGLYALGIRIGPDSPSLDGDGNAWTLYGAAISPSDYDLGHLYDSGGHGDSGGYGDSH